METPIFDRFKFWQPVKLGVIFVALILLTSGCHQLPKDSVQARPQQARRGRKDRIAAVDVKIARLQTSSSTPFIGTSLPWRLVSLRSQIQGQLLGLNVDVGDRVKTDQNLGQVDDGLLRTALNQAEAELASLQSEVARANSQVANSRVEVERLRLEYQQAVADANRLEKLAADGAISIQSAEQARTAAQTAAQALRSAQARVKTDRQAAIAAQGRVVAQTAAVAEAKKRRAYAKLTSPINGVVSAKVSELGNLLQPGTEVLQLSDFSRIKIEVRVTELELANIFIGQPVQIRFDAFPNRTYRGRVNRIVPSASSQGRMVPIEIAMANPNGKISSGLLARVSFNRQNQSRILIPVTALAAFQKKTSSAPNPSNLPQSTQIFTIDTTSKKPRVKSRNVKIGNLSDGNVEVLNGLQAGESYVSRTSKPLKDGELVNLSILSEQLEINQSPKKERTN